MTVRTHGLSHVPLAVKDPERSLAFNAQVRDGAAGGRKGAMRRSGFRIADRHEIDSALESAFAAGERLRARAKFAPGYP
jgi:hypothetical protein